MAQVKLDKIFKRYVGDKGKEVTAVDNFNLDINDKEFVVFVGPSGCGKSTTLRMIAGLEEISEGTISIDRRIVNDIAPKDRDIAMVFQNYALYPHMSVYDNMAFGLKLRKVPKVEIDRRVRSAAGILGIEHFLDRKPKALSGGQRQRVALGRAIVREPKVFLFDEPLSNLDAKMRVQMRAEITKLHRSLNATMIYVTHDQIEAMTMGERIVVMKDGMIQQVASPIELYNSPVNLFVAGFLGSPPMNIIAGTLTKEGDGLIFYEKTGGCIRIDLGARPPAEGHIGKAVMLGLRPEDCEIVTDSGMTPKNSFTANVEISEPVGAETYFYLKTGAHAFTARQAGMGDHSDTGKVLSFKINEAKAHLFDPVTTLRIA